MISIPLGQGARPAVILARYANRHGLIAGATGTGKTYTVATMAEGFSRIGVPVFLCDVKGDLAGMALDGRDRAAPVQFLDVYGERGAPIRASVRAVGAELLARILQMTAVQSDILGAMFASYAGRLESLDDLMRALARPHGFQATKASLQAIRRALIKFRADGGADCFFGAPAFDVARLERRDAQGAGFVSILAAERLIQAPELYGAALLWLLADLYKRAPELGDVAKPRLVLFFDEAHLMFTDAPPALIQRFERMVRLIRSKGIGVYLATQSPADIPPAIAAQLANRVQHAMRAATLADRREIQGAADCLPLNPRVNAARAIATMATGTALVSTLDSSGQPSPVDIVRINAPAGRMGAITDAERAPFIPAALATESAREAAQSGASMGPLAVAFTALIAVILALGAFPHAVALGLALLVMLALFGKLARIS
ncbi:MAG: helicase HerA-like domain-containing protein [Caulobacteraceae bacterium]